ncbi:MAG TPA: hypothetical protein VIL68_05900 [Propionibacteriaceae bacterium]
MTLDEARARIGDGVVYARPYGARETGVITKVGILSVYVRYGGDAYSRLTAAADLTFAPPTPDGAA